MIGAGRPRFFLSVALLGCTETSAPVAAPATSVAREPVEPGPAPAAAPEPARECAPAGDARDRRDQPPTAATFGEVALGPPELVRMREMMTIDEAKCISPEVVEMHEREAFVATGVLYDLTISGDTITEIGMALQPAAFEVLRSAWGPAHHHDCWFTKERRHRACWIASPQPSYAWGDLRFDPVTPLADILGPSPGELVGVPKLVGVPMNDLLALEGVRANVYSQPPGAPPPGRSGQLHLAPSDWGHGETTVQLTLADDPRLTVVSAGFPIPYVDATTRQQVFEVIVDRWAGGKAPPLDGQAYVFRDAAPRVTVRDDRMFDGGSWYVSVEAPAREAPPPEE